MLMPATFLVSALVQFALQLLVAWILGPEEFGRYALTLAGAVLAQTLLFEWLRLAAIRFHHRDAQDGTRARILRTFSWLAIATLALALPAILLPPSLRWLVILIPLLTVANAYAELRAALLRAEFDERGYMRIVLVRNLFALIAMPLGAWFTAHAEGGLAGFLASVLAAITDDMRRARGEPHRARAEAPLSDAALVPTAPAPAATAPNSRDLLGYSGPIILTNAIYLVIFFALRGAIAATGGLAAAGQFSLAFDFVAKLFTTIGTALDLLLFQRAVQTDRAQGRDMGEARLRENLMLLLATIAPMAAGLALVLPGIEALIVAPAYRGPFLAFALMLIPGIATYALVQYAIHPFFQLRHATSHLPIAALLALGLAASGFALARSAGLGLPAASGAALLLAMAAAAIVLLARVGGPALPGLRAFIKLTIALVALVAGALPGAMLTPGAWSLLAGCIGGGLAYFAAAFALDLAGIRALIRVRRESPIS